MSIKSPCIDCTERHVKCHADCDKYLSYRKEVELIAERKRKEKEKFGRSTGIPKAKRKKETQR